MAGERKLTVVLAGDAKGFLGAVDSASGSLKGLGSKFGSFAKTAGVALGGGVIALGALGKSAVDAGSDLNETLSKSNTVFGEQAAAIEQWAGGAAKAFGQSKQQALDAASSFGNMFVQLGIGDKQAAAMSTSMTELASDFASFHNADITEVLTAQQAAFRGEYDALQRFVPTINAAAVEQRALAMTGKETTDELTAQEKALATQTLMMEGAGDAMGDFARTSDGLANKQRIMSARFEDVKAKIGQGLMPVAMSLAGFFVDRLLPAFEEVGGGIMAFVAAFKVGDGDITSAGFPGFMERLANTARNVFDTISAKVREWGPIVIAAFSTVVAWVQQHWPTFQRIIVDAVTTVQAVIAGVVSVVTTLWNNFGNNILSFVQRVWPAVQQIIAGVMNVIRGVIQTITALIKGDWSAVWDGIKRTVQGVWQTIQGIVRGAVEGLRLVIGAGLEVIGSMWRGAWNGLVSAVVGLGSRIRGAASGMWDGITRGFRNAINAVIGMWNRFRITFGGYDIPGPGPNIPGFTIDTPNIPYLAKGGIVTGPTLAMIGEGRYDEAVIPLDGRHGIGGTTVHHHWHIAGSVLTDRDLVGLIAKAKAKGIG